ncbi:uncharacterized protein LOC110233094 [Exaiptasia diaphana]|uniref:C-type lectin domain-containing protein n=1 Tax=Exaiptasia diaphana TaxID=2652724 RepID=A0A913WTT8_EXADI|nr:uncharacterized protein LOC110233094 [Exaiptasia diaphana]XP_020894011.1 uncharacterized protein LOC110233094 [Exaiptasia diaphana]
MATRSQHNWISTIGIFVLVMIISCTASGVEDLKNHVYFSHQFNCSRYTFFYLQLMKWQQSKEACENDNGTLVCIETKEEWRFITSKITSTQIEWYVGLRNVDNHWKWVNGQPLKWTTTGAWPWHSGQPSDGRKYVKMYNKNGEKLFDDVSGLRPLGYICEYKNEDSQKCKMKASTTKSATKTTIGTQRTTNKRTSITHRASTVKTTSTTQATQTTPRASITTKTTSTIPKPMRATTRTSTFKPSKTVTSQTSQTAQGNSGGASTQRNTKQIYAPSSTKTSPNGKPSTTSRKPTAKISDTQIQKGEFPITYLAIALAVLLLFLICMLVAIYCWRKRTKDKGGSGEDGIQSPTTDVSEIMKSNSFVAFKMVHNNIGDGKQPGAKLTNDSTLTDGTYAEIKRSTSVSTPPGQAVNMNENSTSSPSQDVEVVYAAVDKSAKKKGTQEPQVTYADLASFNNNEETVVNMPPPYQPVQYAEIIGTKTSKRK